MCTTSMSNKQLGLALNDIAMQADTIRRLVNIAVCSVSDEEAKAALIEAIDTAAAHVGLVADMALQCVEPVSVVRGDAVKWVMPPAYFHGGGHEL